jgi:hypothetical protein
LPTAISATTLRTLSPRRTVAALPTLAALRAVCAWWSISTRTIVPLTAAAVVTLRPGALHALTALTALTRLPAF